MGTTISNVAPALNAVHSLDTVPTVTVDVNSDGIFPEYRTLNTLRLIAAIYKRDGAGTKYYEWLVYDGVIQPGWTGSITPINPTINPNIAKGYSINLVRDADWRTPNTTGDGYPPSLIGAISQDSLVTLCAPGDEVRFSVSGMYSSPVTSWVYGDLSPPPEVWKITMEEITLANLTPVDSISTNHNIISGLTFECDLLTDSSLGKDFIDLGTLNVSAQIGHAPTSTIYTEPVIVAGVFSPYWSGLIDDLTNGYHLTLTRSQVWSQGFVALGQPARLITAMDDSSGDLALKFDVSDTATYLHPYRFGSSAASYPPAFSAYYYSAYQLIKQWRRELSPFNLRVVTTPGARDPAQHETVFSADTAVIFEVRASTVYPFTVDDIEVFLFPDGALSNTSEVCYTSGGSFAAPWAGSITPLGSNRYQFSLDRNQDWDIGPSLNFPGTIPISGNGTVGIKIGATITGDFAQTLYFGSVIPATLTNPEDEWSWSVQPASFPQTLWPLGLGSAQALGSLLVSLFDQYVFLASPSPSIAIGASVITPVEADITPRFSSFRGGEELLIHATQQLTNTALDHDFRGQSLPSGWVSFLASGARIRHSLQGAVLATGPTAGSYIQLDTAPLHEACSATLRVRPLTPDQAQTSPVTCVAFSYVVDGVSYATLRIRRNALVDSTQVLVDSVIGLADETMIGGAIVRSPLQNFDLQVVRVQNYVFLLVNGQQVASTSRFTAEGVGSFRVLVSNDTMATKVSTRIERLEVRSHALIGGRLLQSKTDIGDRRVVGTTPAASLAEVGLHDIILFGPWGVAAQSEAFSYILPDGRRIGGAAGTPLTSYVDPSVKD